MDSLFAGFELFLLTAAAVEGGATITAGKADPQWPPRQLTKLRVIGTLYDRVCMGQQQGCRELA